MKAPRGESRVTLKKWSGRRDDCRWAVRWKRVGGSGFAFGFDRKDAWDQWAKCWTHIAAADPKFRRQFECARVTLVTRED